MISALVADLLILRPTIMVLRRFSRRVTRSSAAIKPASGV